MQRFARANRASEEEKRMREDQPPSKIRFWPQSVFAGFPSPGDDYLEPPLDLHDLVVDHPLTTYFLRVSGDSMTGACIADQDVIVVDRALTVAHNKIVVARVGEHLVLKRVKVRQRKIFLRPDPPGYPVIELRKDDEIWGVGAHCIHRLP